MYEVKTTQIRKLESRTEEARISRKTDRNQSVEQCVRHYDNIIIQHYKPIQTKS